MSHFLAWLASERGRSFGRYEHLWRWSVDRPEEFWSCLWDYFEVGGEHGRVLVRGNGAEGALWFPGTTINYVDHVLRHPPDATAVVACSEDGASETVTYGGLAEMAGAAAAGLRRIGVGQGDRVAAVLPNGVEAVVGFLATASLGATWSSCAPEFGTPSMVDRFRQIEPKVLLMAAGYRYRGRSYDLAEKLADLERELPGLAATVVVGGGQRASWDELLAEPAPLVPEPVSFSHPLWILYSSGTSGLPKPIVHAHGGILLEHLKALALHSDLGPGDRFFWFTTTGWMMWNFLVGGLLVGATIVCYDGDPFWPDPVHLWHLARELGVTYFGTSAPYLDACRRAGVSPRKLGPLEVRSVGSTGAPLSPEGFAWASREVADDVQVGSVSGGTDVCTAFLTSCPLLPVRAGELQCRALGVKVEAYDHGGSPVVGEVGELVVTEPMPSMPIAFWGDGGGVRLHESYFGRYPGVWRHGDWVKITQEGSAVVYGRSDATLNRGGVRVGTSEFYRVVEALEDVADSLVVDTSELGREGQLLLFVVPSHPVASQELQVCLSEQLRVKLSPRHVPDRVVVLGSLPKTINGKKLEVPVRRILMGLPVEEAVAPGALAQPEALEDLLAAARSAGLL